MDNLLSWLKQCSVSTSTPRYLQLAQAIEQGIEQGMISTGDFLPAERKLAQYLSMSRVTISKTMALLEQQGIVLRKQGQGTRVIKRIDYSLTKDQGVTAQLLTHFVQLSNQWLLRTKQQATSAQASKLGLNEGDSIAYLRRIRLADGLPISLESTCIPIQYLPEPEKLENSLYSWWQEKGIELRNKSYRLQAIACSAQIAALLEVAENSPLLWIEQISREENGEIVELSEILCRSDIYELSVQSDE